MSDIFPLSQTNTAFNVTISSRTPEGLPHRCPVCGQAARLDPSYPVDDSCCPHCGHLLFWLRDQISEQFDVDPSTINFSTSLQNLDMDSLDLVELSMKLEAEMRDEDIAQIQTVADFVRYLQNRGPQESI